MRNLSSLELESGTKVHIKVISQRMLTVQPLGARHEILDDNGKLVGLNYDGEFFIGKGSVLTVGQQKYKINEIVKDHNSSFQGYELYTFRKITTTGNFILPFLGETRVYFRWNLEYINAFIGVEGEDTSNQYVYVLYKFSGSQPFTDFESKLKEREDFIEATDPDAYTVMYKFKLPEERRADISRILEGKYSEVSEVGKKMIMEFHKCTKEQPIGQILHKCPARRKQMEKDLGVEIPVTNELYQKFEPEKEIYLTQYAIREHDTSTPTGDFI